MSATGPFAVLAIFSGLAWFGAWATSHNGTPAAVVWTLFGVTALLTLAAVLCAEREP